MLFRSQADLWCNNLCSQDEAYCQPFVKGDKIYFQYFNDNTAFWKVLPKLFDAVTDEQIASDAYITTQTGLDSNGSSYFNIVIDTTSLPIDCFYMKVFLFNCEVNEALYDACVLAHVALGETQEEAEFNCSIEYCGEGVTEIQSEPFCAIPCEKTLLIEGVYPGYDCNGNFYGDLQVGTPPVTATNLFKLSFRIPAELVKENFGFTTTIVNNTKQKSTQTDAYVLRSLLLPPYVAEMLATAFNAKQLFIDGVEYDSGVEIAKNNDEGQMWIINTQVTKKCSEINFNCE